LGYLHRERGRAEQPNLKGRPNTMLTILLIVLLVILLVGGFGFSRRGRRGV
jgi:flagellar basal body-associated protein FliL